MTAWLAAAAPLRAALLDDQPRVPGRDRRADRRDHRAAYSRSGAETAVAALADVPQAGRVVALGRMTACSSPTFPNLAQRTCGTGCGISSGWLIAAEGAAANGAGPPGDGRGVLVGSAGIPQPSGADVHELLLGTIDLLGRQPA